MATDTETNTELSLAVEVGTGNVQSGNEGWSSGIFDCFDDDDSCLMDYCCPCVLFGYNCEIINQGEWDCAAGALFYTFLLSWGFHWMLGRCSNLSGSTDSDWAIQFFCHWCALAQEYKELTKRGYVAEDGWQANKVSLDAKRAQQRTAAVTRPVVQAPMSRDA